MVPTQQDLGCVWFASVITASGAQAGNGYMYIRSLECIPIQKKVNIKSSRYAQPRRRFRSPPRLGMEPTRFVLACVWFTGTITTMCGVPAAMCTLPFQIRFLRIFAFKIHTQYEVVYRKKTTPALSSQHIKNINFLK